MNPIMREALGDLLGAAAVERASVTVVVVPESDIAVKLRAAAEQASRRECAARRHSGDMAAMLRETQAELVRTQTAVEMWEGAAHEIAETLQPLFGKTKLTAHSAVWAAHQVAAALDEAREQRLEAQGDLAATVHLVGQLVNALAPLAALAEGREGMHARASVMVDVGLLRAARAALRQPRVPATGDDPTQALLRAVAGYVRHERPLAELEAALAEAERAGLLDAVAAEG